MNEQPSTIVIHLHLPQGTRGKANRDKITTPKQSDAPGARNLREAKKRLQEIIDIPSSTVDPHAIGMTNGLLLAMSVLTGQEPDFVVPPMTDAEITDMDRGGTPGYKAAKANPAPITLSHEDFGALREAWGQMCERVDGLEREVANWKAGPNGERLAMSPEQLDLDAEIHSIRQRIDALAHLNEPTSPFSEARAQPTLDDREAWNRGYHAALQEDRTAVKKAEAECNRLENERDRLYKECYQLRIALESSRQELCEYADMYGTLMGGLDHIANRALTLNGLKAYARDLRGRMSDQLKRFSAAMEALQQ